MWSRQLFFLGFFALTILTTQSHVIHKRGLISRLFGGNSKSNHDVEQNLPPRERSKYRELLKNPIVIAMLSAAVGMIVQQALAARNMNDVCDNKYVKMAYAAGSLNPQLQQALSLLGCHGPNRKYGKTEKPYDKFSTTTFSPNGDENEDEESNIPTADENENLESGFPPEKESQIQQLLNIARGQKGAKRNFIKNLFGSNKGSTAFRKGQKLPSSSYKLDKDDANSLKDLEKELEQYNKQIN